MLNPECVRLAIMAALSLGCKIARRSAFDRKHYFYRDSPLGYQITQHYRPLATDGVVRFASGNRCRAVPIVQLHLEQDTGRSLAHPLSAKDRLVDLNRAGLGLVELVTAPVMTSAAETVACAKAIRAALKDAGACDGNMELGSLRVDVNVSLRKDDGGKTVDYPRCEIKNLNSFRFMSQAIESEVARQQELLQKGCSLQSATCAFDSDSGKTRVTRVKGSSVDYRYIPEFDVPELQITDAEIGRIREDMPEASEHQRQRLVQAHGIDVGMAERLAMYPCLVALFEQVCGTGVDVRLAYHWITGELVGQLHKVNIDPTAPELELLNEAALVELLRLIHNGRMATSSAKQVVAALLSSNRPQQSIEEVVHRLGLGHLASSPEGHPGPHGISAELASFCRDLVAGYPEKAQQIRNGRTRILSFFVGEAMRKAAGTATPQSISSYLQQLISSQTAGINDGLH